MICLKRLTLAAIVVAKYKIPARGWTAVEVGTERSSAEWSRTIMHSASGISVAPTVSIDMQRSHTSSAHVTCSMVREDVEYQSKLEVEYVASALTSCEDHLIRIVSVAEDRQVASAASPFAQRVESRWKRDRNAVDMKRRLCAYLNR